MRFLETRPGPDEFNPFYAPYIARVPAGDLTEILAVQQLALRRLLAHVDEAGALRRYAPGKWSVKEVLGHIADAERVFAYRALRFARADATPLSSFDENAWVPAGGFDRRGIEALAGELAAVRAGTIALFASLDEAAWLRQGTASGNPVSVRALGCIIAGHELHHVAILRERYGVGAAPGGR